MISRQLARSVVGDTLTDRETRRAHRAEEHRAGDPGEQVRTSVGGVSDDSSSGAPSDAGNSRPLEDVDAATPHGGRRQGRRNGTSSSASASRAASSAGAVPIRAVVFDVAARPAGIGGERARHAGRAQAGEGVGKGQGERGRRERVARRDGLPGGRHRD